MKKLLMILTMMPSLTFANYVTKTHGGQTYVFKTRIGLDYNKELARGCDMIKLSLELMESSGSFDEYKVKLLDSGTGPKSWVGIEEQIPVTLSFEENDERIKQDVSESLGVEYSTINVINPDIDKAAFFVNAYPKDYTESIFIRNLLKLNKSLSGKLTKTRDQRVISVKGRLSYCALMENKVNLWGSFSEDHELKTSVSPVLVNKLFTYYKDVSRAWKTEEQKNMKNVLHKLLVIGTILKEKGAERKINQTIGMTEAFDKFFNTYNKADGDEGISVYLKNLSSEEAFKAEVYPDQKLNFTVNGTVEQI